MIGSRIVAAALLIGAAAWILSGQMAPSRTTEAPKTGPGEQAAATQTQRVKVAVMSAVVEPRVRPLRLSGVTEAERRVMATSRTNGIVVELLVRSGDAVRKGDVLARLSDEAREAAVTQARARLEQRVAEWKAREKLIERGTLPTLNRPQLEAEAKQAEAALALAMAERDRGTVVAPIDGVVNSVPTEIGQALQNGGAIAEVMSLDPILAVGEISERRLGQIRIDDAAEIRLATGAVAKGVVRFISSRAVPQTRTYRIEVAIANKDRSIRDGITAEIALSLAPTAAASVPRSALTFSSEGKLGVRVVVDGKVRFVAVTIVEDTNENVWIAGLETGMQVIVRGQDFVIDGQSVEASVLPPGGA